MASMHCQQLLGIVGVLASGLGLLGPGGVHYQLQGLPILCLHQVEEAGLVLRWTVTDAAILPIKQHCPAMVALWWSHHNGCHVSGHVYQGGLVGPGHWWAWESQSAHLQQWLGRAMGEAKKPSSHNPCSG